GLLLLLTLGTTADQVNNTIVVQTPLQNYEQPTLRDYEECQGNRDRCVDVCGSDLKCQGECPVCPELYSRPLLVQGVNDTDQVAPPQTPVNTTNIIRLTNEIQNIIQHEIQQRNEVNVVVQQNVSQVGGRFGLGYSDQGSCCYVVRMDRNCDKGVSDDCREKSRQRVCGERCQARVMLAKKVVQCEEADPNNCRETIEYVPRRRRNHTRKTVQSEPCQYFGNYWPYFSCGQNEGQFLGNVVQNQRPKRSSCQQCLNLPYGVILQKGLPPQCAGCFQGYGQPYMLGPYGFNPFMPYVPPYGGFPANNNNNNNLNNNVGEDIDNNDDIAGSGGYILCDDNDLDKCLQDNGMSQMPEGPAHQEQSPDEDGYGVEVQRRRRQNSDLNFVRSAYSKRYRNVA
ncbi:hypothetical protein KR018_001613, partial [Drosophila ironensis]